MALSDRDRAILDLERCWWTEAVPKDAQIKACLDLSTSRYYGRLNELLDLPEAEAYDPLVVKRLRRLREARRRARQAAVRAELADDGIALVDPSILHRGR